VDWNAAEIAETAVAFRHQHELRNGNREERLQADDYWWAWERVNDAATEGSAPIELLDVLLRDPQADAAYRAYIAAGPLEDALRADPLRYGPLFDARSHEDELWAEAVGGIWLDDAGWAALPAGLQALIPEPARMRAKPEKTRKPKRPSKRQGRRGRREAT
jgi:hypothetical protein